MSNQLVYKTIKTVNGQTGYVSMGSGKPLVMLVGYSGNLLHWNSHLIYKLAERYTVYLPDNRLVGKTQSSNPETMQGLATDTIDFIQALGLEQAILCGWSMGGIIAQAIAYSHCALISGISLIVSQPDYSYTLNRLHQLVANLRLHPGKENREKLTELFFSGIPTVEFRKYLAKAILPVTHYVYPFSREAEELQNKAVANWHSDISKLESINVPILISCAKNDMVTDPRASFILHQYLPCSKLVSYSDGGHFFLHKYPEQLAIEIINFFSHI